MKRLLRSLRSLTRLFQCGSPQIEWASALAAVESKGQR